MRVAVWSSVVVDQFSFTYRMREPYSASRSVYVNRNTTEKIALDMVLGLAGP